ncbi:hypothetical protein LJC02_01905 [Breznakia sp. OttesenSCG-928-G09]|nr:hypothetical protein [Breznakia sp. OttesenSCG-928-G09]
MKEKANKSIRVKSSSLYTIEVNDKGDVIELDMSDLSFFSGLQKTLNNIDKLSKNIKKEMKTIDAMDDTEMLDEYISKKSVAQMELLNQFYNDARKEIDNILGENACQKIFGDKNFITMFDDLFEALEPSFEDMRKKQELKSKEMRKKYALSNKKSKSKLS